MSYQEDGKVGTNSQDQKLPLAPADSPLKRQRGPPTNVIVITGSPDSTRFGEQDALQSPLEIPFASIGGVEDTKRSISEGGTVSVKLTELSPFKLRPRNPMLATCTPSPSSRKRRANSMSVPEVACVEMTKASPPRYPSNLPNYSGSIKDSRGSEKSLECEQRSSRTMPAAHGISPPIQSSPSTTGAPDSLNLQDLSLQSPIAHRPVIHAYDYSPAKNQQYGGNRRVGSSFTAFSESPGRPLHKAETPGSLSTSSTNNLNSRTSCSSAKSSPRQVPLTVISNSQGACSPLKPPPPPYHPLAETASTWLYSVNDDDESDSDAGSPKRLSAAATAVSLHLTPQNITKMPPDHEYDMSIGQNIKSTTSPLVQLSNNNNNDGYTLPSPRTPLPKIALAPRTPLSQASPGSNSACLPVYPYSPAAGSEVDPWDSIGCTSNVESRYSGGEHLSHPDQQMWGVNHSSRPAAPAIGHFWQRESNNSLAFSTDGSKDGINNASDLQNSNSFGCLILEEETRKPSEIERDDQAARPSFLPSHDDWNNSTPHSTNVMSHCQSSFGDEDKDVGGTPQRNNKKFPCKPEITSDTTIGSKSQSFVKSPTSDIMFAALQDNEQRKSEDFEQDSLSDSDDGFILAHPGDIAEEKMDATSKILEYHDRHKDGRSIRRVKQRCHSSFSNKSSSLHVNVCSSGESLCLNLSSSGSNEDVRYLSSSTLDSALPKRSSSASLNYQSASSLFGMDIVHEEECSNGLPSKTPFCGGMPHKAARSHSANGLRRKDSGTFDSSGSLSRKRSDQSLGSLGLTLEGSLAHGEDSNRDLVTPPIVRSNVKSPPPLFPVKSQKIFGFQSSPNET